MLGNSPVIWGWQPVWLKNIWPLNLYLLFLVLLSLTSTRYAGYMFIGFIVARIAFIPTAAHRKFVGRAFQSFCIVKSLIFLICSFQAQQRPWRCALLFPEPVPPPYLTWPIISVWYIWLLLNAWCPGHHTLLVFSYLISLSSLFPYARCFLVPDRSQ